MEVGYYVENAVEDGQSMEQFLEYYDYLPEQDKQELIKIYNESL
jgi:hypothetical protein